MSIDTIGDFLTIIRNGARASKRFVVAPYSKMKDAVARILKDEGFINDYAIDEEDGRQVLKISLRYFQGKSVIHKLRTYEQTWSPVICRLPRNRACY